MILNKELQLALKRFPDNAPVEIGIRIDHEDEESSCSIDLYSISDDPIKWSRFGGYKLILMVG